MGNTDKEKFMLELIDFFEKFICGTSNAVKVLAGIQDKYKLEYEKFKETKRNPEALLKLVEDLDDNKKVILFEIMTKSASLASRTQIIFELNKEEQLKLAEDLEQFSNNIKEKIMEIKKND